MRTRAYGTRRAPAAMTALAATIALVTFPLAACHPPPARPDPAVQAADLGATDAALADSWPPEGPPRLWTRKLGPGYSGIVALDDRLYTMYRDEPAEVVVCLDARSGATIWEYRYDAPLADVHDSDYGDGPNAGPLLADGRLYTAGVAGILHALDARTGERLWSRDLWGELGGNAIDLGYSSTPVVFGNTLIALVGAEDGSIVAFDREDGSVVWRNLSFKNTFSSPRIFPVHGEDQLVTCMAREVVGVDPRTGALLWRYPIVNSYEQNIARPLPIGDDVLFVSTLEAGSRALRPVPGEPFAVEELWSTRRMQLFYNDAVKIGDFIYGTSGTSTAPRMTAIHAATGKLAWRSRGFGLAHLVAVGDRLVILDEQGTLTLATPGPDGLVVHAEARVATAPSRTPPALRGTVLFVRDFHEITALDLGR